jgi:copper transport protein
VRRLLPLLAALVATGWFAPAAAAHANLVSTSPRDGGTVGTAPTEVRVRFDDRVSVGPGNAVVDSTGQSVLAGRPRLAKGGRELLLPLKQVSNGDYSARWGIVSDDGHLESGVLAFRVGSGASGAAPPTSTLQAETTRPGAADVLARWLYLGGILVAGGTALFSLFVSGGSRRRTATTFALALIPVVFAAAWLLHTTHGGSTRFGHVTQVALVVAAAGALAAALSLTYPRLHTAALAASLALLSAPPLSGHALDAGETRPLSLTLDLVHVAAAAFWIGGLLQLALLLRGGDDGGAARRFSRLARPVVALLALAGAGRAVEELTAISQLWSTGYGREILIKSALLVVLVALARVSRGRLGSPARLLESVSAELIVLAVVVAAAGLLTALRPGRDAAAAASPLPVGPTEVASASLPPKGTVVFGRQSRELAVALAVRPGRPLRLSATVLGQTGRGVDGLDVQLAAVNKTGSASAPARACGHGCYAADLRLPRPTLFAVNIVGAGQFRSVAFPVPGPWPPPLGGPFLRRASRVFRGLHSVVLLERLASNPEHQIMTTWKLVAPNRVEYAIRDGAGGIIIGRRRWDRPAPGAKWRLSPSVVLRQPTAPWGRRFEDVRLLRETRDRLVASWLDPTVPAWFTATFDRRTALPTTLRMTAAAHFMRHRYVQYNGPVRIQPPSRAP